ncbi:hypothetical protein [Reyranella sp.]|uniref:hypothetical protein n=1 Tax=Reyranella sp. TaxID=1929291 RepID=UPI003D0F9963
MALRKAWVVTISRSDPSVGGAERVIGLLSARRGPDFVEQYLEGLALAMGLSLADQLDATNYNKPVDVFLRYHTSWVDKAIDTRVFLLRAQYSQIIDLRVLNGREVLEWIGRPYRRTLDGPRFEPPAMACQKAEFILPGILPEMIVDPEP